MSTDLTELLLAFFKALSDANRLRIVGLLAREPHAVEDLASSLGLGASTVSHHLGKLVAAGLVSGQVRGHHHVYTLDVAALQARARQLLATETLVDVAKTVDLDVYDRGVLAAFVGPDGRLKQLPMQRKKFDAVLRYALRRFEPGGVWTERQMNRILGEFADDVASLRRGFIDTGRMSRNPSGSRYWRTDAPPVD